MTVVVSDTLEVEEVCLVAGLVVVLGDPLSVVVLGSSVAVESGSVVS